MIILKCNMCGGDIVVSPDKTFGTCEYCGSTATLPKVDNEQRAAIFNRGNDFRRLGEFDKALEIYEHIVMENDMDAEAHWGCVLSRFGIEYVEDPNTYERIPTCHRASFDSILEDVDYKAAIKYSDGITRRLYQKEAARIAQVQREILELSQKSEPFDIFISFKNTDDAGNPTPDSMLAQDIYYKLVGEGYRVFFSRVTLMEVAGEKYEPYIFSALNSAKIMLVIGTKKEYMDATWVKNEWSRFLALKKKDNSKVLFPCYRDMNPNEMPEKLKTQGFDMGRIGFIQDLLQGIAKILKRENNSRTIERNKTEQVIRKIELERVQQQVENYVSLGAMALDSGDTEKATKHFEDALKQDSECIGAYLGLIRVFYDKDKVTPYVNKINDMNVNDVLSYIEAHEFIIGDEGDEDNLLSLAVHPIGSEELVLGLLEMGLNGNEQNVLMDAVECFDSGDIINAFIKNNADVNMEQSYEYQYKDNSMCRKRIEYEQHSVLSWAIKNDSDMEVIKQLVSAGANINYNVGVYDNTSLNMKHKHSYSILNLAIRTNDKELVKFLVNEGVNRNEKRIYFCNYSRYNSEENKIIYSGFCEGKSEYSILSDSIWNVKSVEMLKVLLEAGAEVNMNDNRMLVEEGKENVLFGYAQTNALIDAILYNDDVEMIKVLLEHGANPNSKYIFDNIPRDGKEKPRGTFYKSEIPVLGLAVERKQKGTVKLLIEAGASFTECAKFYSGGTIYNNSYYWDEEDVFALSEYAFDEDVVREMGEIIKKYGWKGSKSGWFRKAHACQYSW